MTNTTDRIVKLFKDGKIITPAAMKKLDEALDETNGKDNLSLEIEVEKMLIAIYSVTNDPIQKILLKDIFKYRGIKLPKPEETGDVIA